MDVIPLRAGVKLPQIIDRVEWSATEAGNANSWGGGPGQSTSDRIGKYLSWTEDVEPQLRNVFDGEFVAEAIRTTGYWTLRTISPDVVRVTTLVRTEYEGRIRFLNALAAQLKAEQARWDSYAAPLIVPDTNVFLDPDTSPEQVDWAAEIDATINVRVVVPLVVVRELDRLKRQGNNTTGRLARRAIKWLAACLPDDVNAHSEVLNDARTPGATIETYLHGGVYRPEEADGIISDFCRWLRAIAGLPVTLVTRDLGMSVLARAAGLSVALRLPEP
jgi:hypothetical protein